MSASVPFIIITGNIGAGKSTLAGQLAAELGLEAHLERVEHNPFFGAPSQQPLECEAWFLADSVATHRAIQGAGRGGVQERSAMEHIPVFARARHRLGWLSDDGLALLEILDDLLGEGLEPPDLLVYLEADLATIQRRIAERARPEEQAIDASYLTILAELCDEFVDGWRLSPVYRLDSTRVDVRSVESTRIAWREMKRTLRE